MLGRTLHLTCESHWGVPKLRANAVIFACRTWGSAVVRIFIHMTLPFQLRRSRCYSGLVRGFLLEVYLTKASNIVLSMLGTKPMMLYW